jgi:hypothetical protein
LPDGHSWHSAGAACGRADFRALCSDRFDWKHAGCGAGRHGCLCWSAGYYRHGIHRRFFRQQAGRPDGRSMRARRHDRNGPPDSADRRMRIGGCCTAASDDHGGEVRHSILRNVRKSADRLGQAGDGRKTERDDETGVGAGRSLRRGLRKALTPRSGARYIFSRSIGNCVELQKFFYPVLESLDEGGVMRTIGAIGLRCVGVLVALGGLLGLVEVLRFSFQANAAEITLAGLVLGLAILGAVAIILQIFFYRADCIRDLPTSRFTVIPIFSIMVRTAGEVYAALTSVIGVAGCLALWLAGRSVLPMLGAFGLLLLSNPSDSSFLGGLAFAFTVLVVAMVVLILSYFFAESIVVLADIATNMNVLTHHWVPETHSPSSIPAAPVPQRKQAREQVYSSAPMNAQQSYENYAKQSVEQSYTGRSWRNPESGAPEPPIFNQSPPAPAPVSEPPRQAAPTNVAPPQSRPEQQYQAPVAPQQSQSQGQAPTAPREPRTRIRIVQRCRNCGAELASGSASCPSCGA